MTSLDEIFRKAGLNPDEDETAAQMIQEIQALINKEKQDAITAYVKYHITELKTAHPDDYKDYETIRKGA